VLVAELLVREGVVAQQHGLCGAQDPTALEGAYRCACSVAPAGTRLASAEVAVTVWPGDASTGADHPILRRPHDQAPLGLALGTLLSQFGTLAVERTHTRAACSGSSRRCASRVVISRSCAPRWRSSAWRCACSASSSPTLA